MNVLDTSLYIFNCIKTVEKTSYWNIYKNILKYTYLNKEQPETTQKLHETTWNQPYYSIFYLIKILNYFQFAFVLILHHKVFYAQIWSKVTEIWYRSTLLYVYHDFNAYFFKSLVIHIILDKFGLKIWCCHNWVQSSICEHYQYYMLIIIKISII